MPAHNVTITKPFYFGKYLVTQEQWERIMGSNPSHFKGAKNPVDSVSWEDCQTFLRKLKENYSSQHSGCRRKRSGAFLSSCSTTNFFFGDSDALLGEYAWDPYDGGNSLGNSSSWRKEAKPLGALRHVWPCLRMVLRLVWPLYQE